jgi:hypothetical protein
LISALGGWWLKSATPYGLGLRTDSAQYINGARNLLAGEGYTRTSGGGVIKPITHFPPLFSMVIALLGAFLYATSGPSLNVYAWVMSESLYFLIWVTAFLVPFVYRQHPKTWLLVILGSICGAAYLTRYIGLSLFLTIALYLILTEAGWKRVFRSLAWLTGPFLILILVWSFQNFMIMGSITNQK